jgi:hypothetical protein
LFFVATIQAAGVLLRRSANAATRERATALRREKVFSFERADY